MKKYNVAVLGATGAVGREMLKVLSERKFPINELKCLSSPKSAGSKIEFCGQKYTVELAQESSFAGMDIVISAVGNKTAKYFAPFIREAGAVMVDNSSAFRLDEDVPLIVPEINPEDVYKHKGIIANPNCSTIIAAVAVNPIKNISPIKTIVASTYQAVSGAGAEGLVELEEQSRALVNGTPFANKVFPYQIAFNLIPQIGDFDDVGYTSEEMKMQNEGRKIMHLPELRVNCTCVRVPVLRSHSISITLTTESPVSVEEAKRAIASGKGCKLVDDPASKIYPMPLDTSDQDLVFVGRIRKDLTDETNGLTLWCSGDQIRKGAATNAVQIAELLIT